MRIAVTLHLANLNALNEILQQVSNLEQTQTPFDLFVNLAEKEVDCEYAAQVIRARYPQATIIHSENRGMDIGGFLQLLPLVLEGYDATKYPLTLLAPDQSNWSIEQFFEMQEPLSPSQSTRALPLSAVSAVSATQQEKALGQYDYILKLHSKKNDSWRNSLINPICGSAKKVRECLRQFLNHPRIGMIGASDCLCRENSNSHSINFYHLKQITEQLGLVNSSNLFIGGTIFWIRSSILKAHFTPLLIAKMLASCNTLQTFDCNWYRLNYKHLKLDNESEAFQHWNRYGKHSGLACNYLDAQRRLRTISLPDGMIEHAYERVFGLLVTQMGFKTLGVL